MTQRTRVKTVMAIALIGLVASAVFAGIWAMVACGCTGLFVSGALWLSENPRGLGKERTE